MHRELIRKLIAFRQVYRKDSKMQVELIKDLKKKVAKTFDLPLYFIENDLDGLQIEMKEYGEDDDE